MDQRQLCSLTLSRLLHTRHPNQIYAHATLNSLQHAVYMVPGRDQIKYNRLGDSYGKKESLNILERMCEGSDAPVKALKEKVEGLYSGNMMSASARYRKSVANRLNIFGIGRFADNIALVSIHVHFLRLRIGLDKIVQESILTKKHIIFLCTASSFE